MKLIRSNFFLAVATLALLILLNRCPSPFDASASDHQPPDVPVDVPVSIERVRDHRERHSRIMRLQIAGALLAAEIDRMQREALSG